MYSCFGNNGESLEITEEVSKKDFRDFGLVKIRRWTGKRRNGG